MKQIQAGRWKLELDSHGIVWLIELNLPPTTPTDPADVQALGEALLEMAKVMR